MKTADLIAVLAADTRITPPRLALRSALGLAASALLMVLFWGVRPDLGAAVARPLVAAKFLLPLLLAGLMIWAWPAPEARARPLLALGPALAAALLVAVTLPAGDPWAAIRGQTLWACLRSVPMLALPVGIGLFAALRGFVVTDAPGAGWVAGLLAGALGATVYAFHCDEDAPAFYAIWYSVGILVSGLAGHFAGRRWLGV